MAAQRTGQGKCPAPPTRRESAATKKAAAAKRRATIAKKHAQAAARHVPAAAGSPAQASTAHPKAPKAGKKPRTAKQIAASKKNALKFAAAGRAAQKGKPKTAAQIAAAVQNLAKTRGKPRTAKQIAAAKRNLVKGRAAAHTTARAQSKRYRTGHAAHKACHVAHRHAGAQVHGGKHPAKMRTAKQKAAALRWAAAGRAAEARKRKQAA